MLKVDGRKWGQDMIGANKHWSDATFGLGCLDGKRADVLLEILKADGLADHAVHAYVSVERSGFGAYLGGDSDDVCIAIGSEDTIFTSSDATSALDTVEIGHLDIHEDEIKDLGAKQLQCLETAVKADGRTR